MFSEFVHSGADTLNQLILAWGLRQSVRGADEEHPYGYSSMPYVSSLISGVGIFFMGAGVTAYHGVTGLMRHEHQFESLSTAFAILAVSFVSESVTLAMALRLVRPGFDPSHKLGA